MKRFMRVITVVLALAALVQTVYVYAVDCNNAEIKKEEQSIKKLLELKELVKEGSESFADIAGENQNEFPIIKDENEFQAALISHMLKYLEAVGGKEAQKKFLEGGQFVTKCAGPGI